MPRSSRAELGGSHYGIVLSIVLFLVLILWLTGNLKQAPSVKAPGLDFNSSPPATRR
jgi:hypothetical protein